MYKNLTLLGILTGLMFASLPIKSEPTNAVPDLVRGNNAFAFDLYGKLKSRDGNLFFSPLSISTSLGMAYAGARGETEKQMAQTLHFGTNQNQLHAQFSQLLSDFDEKGLEKLLRNSTPEDAQIANAIYVQKGQPLSQGFQNIVTQSYHAFVKQVDFRTEKVSACKEINEWVSDKTSGKIREIVQPRDLDDLTQIALVNTVHFKGGWMFRFYPASTTQQPFTIAQGESKDVRMMHKNEGFPYYQDEDLQATELFYTEGQFSMLILLPRKQDGLKALEAKLSAETLMHLTSGMRGRHVDVFIPKFKLSFGAELSECLKTMGMQKAFSAHDADFSGMDGARDLHISAVFHKAVADVNEDGTEAAASSVHMMSNGMDLDPPPTFRADHPFIFLIRERKSGSILFMGRVIDPTK
ncbi:serpin family protein [Pedosphaera parvula]|uniref:Proteinase inhibitor I4 serpin n=1 Tax=Pedosphaera parvula (strain Ellin514) TaxID=320771 RepID=B9XLN4_PEDPL|nr:serpin family protein [Pedosphaera parvula]EEF59282.1 proteinase inhibitor I4 serpin [Pedosphaera parvula Ellin514]